nr:hypothetical protein GCM10010200_083060 [Actinomadura rugatobispora]
MAWAPVVPVLGVGVVPTGCGRTLREMPLALVLMHVLIEGEAPDRALVDRIVDRVLAPLLGTRPSGRSAR